jgi:hypothetical protein
LQVVHEAIELRTCGGGFGVYPDVNRSGHLSDFVLAAFEFFHVRFGVKLQLVIGHFHD